MKPWHVIVCIYLPEDDIFKYLEPTGNSLQNKTTSDPFINLGFSHLQCSDLYTLAWYNVNQFQLSTKDKERFIVRLTIDFNPEEHVYYIYPT